MKGAWRPLNTFNKVILQYELWGKYLFKAWLPQLRLIELLQEHPAMKNKFTIYHVTSDLSVYIRGLNKAQKKRDMFLTQW